MPSHPIADLLLMRPVGEVLLRLSRDIVDITLGDLVPEGAVKGDREVIAVLAIRNEMHGIGLAIQGSDFLGEDAPLGAEEFAFSIFHHHFRETVILPHLEGQSRIAQPPDVML